MLTTSDHLDRIIQMHMKKWVCAHISQVGQDGPVPLIWVPDKRPIRRGNFLPQGYNLNRSPCTSNAVSIQLTFQFMGSSNRFLRWQPWQSSWILKQNKFSYFWSTSHPNNILSSFESIGLTVPEKKFKINFEDGSHGGHYKIPS